MKNIVYKYSRKNIAKDNIKFEKLATDTTIKKVELIENNLYLYMNSFESFFEPFVDAGECYSDCLLIIKNVFLSPLYYEKIYSNTSQKHFDELKVNLKYRSLYMSYKEFLNDGCDDTNIYFRDGNLIVVGYGKDCNNSSLWANFYFEFDNLDFYCNEIYDYMSSKTIG